MREQTLRTIGATVVLFGIAVAAILQVGPGGDPSAIALTAEGTSTTSTESIPESTLPSGPAESSTTVPEPFNYRIGVSTTNYWAFFAEEPSVWNSYILGPTKAALFSIEPGTGVIGPELAAEIPQPAQTENGWQVEVRLRTDLYWSDGAPITASDVEFTFETVRVMGLGGSWASVFPPSVESVKAAAPDRLTIEFSERPTIQVWPHGPGLAPIMSEAFWSDQAAARGLGNPDWRSQAMKILRVGPWCSSSPTRIC